MYDQEGVKTIKSFEFSFCMSNLKSWSPKKYKVEGPNKHNSNQFTVFPRVSQNYSTIFLNEFIVWFFSPRSSVFEAYFQEPSTLQEVKIAIYRVKNKNFKMLGSFFNQ